MFVLFLSMAFFILIITKLSQNYTNTLRFEIETVNVPAEIVLINRNSTLDISFKADGFKWLSYVFNSPKIKIDFKKDSLIRTTDYLFRINDNKKKLNSYLPKTAESILYNTEGLVFEFDLNYTKMTPVKLVKNIEFSNGFDIVDSIKISPQKVKLIGPKSILDTVEFVSTKRVELKKVNSSKNITIDLDFKAYNSSIKSNVSKVDLSFEVDKFTEGSFLVPLELINKPKTTKVTYFPKNATVVYYTTLNHFNSVRESDFKVIIDYNTINSTSNYLVPRLDFNNSNVKTARVNLKKVDYIITE